MSSQSSTQTRTIEDLDPGFLRQRRNLLAISTGLIVLISSGGTIERTSLFFGMISVQKPYILEISIWIFFFYSLWRYWLYREDPQSRVEKAIKNELCNDSLLQNTALKFKDGGKNPFSFNSNPVLYTNFLNCYLDFSQSYNIKVSGTLERTFAEATFNEGKKEKINFFVARFIQAKVIVKAFIHDRAISDYYIPYCLSLAALVLWTIAKCT